MRVFSETSASHVQDDQLKAKLQEGYLRELSIDPTMTERSILLIGPVSQADVGRIGGVTIPFEEFSSWCKAQAQDTGVRVLVAPLTGRDRLEILRSYIRGAAMLLTPRCSQVVSLHATWRALALFAIPLAIAAVILRKRITIRKFAGNFDDYYRRASAPVRALMRASLMSCDIVYFETLYLTDWAKRAGFRAAWWPNSRFMPNVTDLEPRQQRDRTRLVFVGSVTIEKGLQVLLRVAQARPDIDVIVHGPATQAAALEILQGATPPNFQFKGALARERVYQELASADALLLPTNWASEGYPGVILEAACVGTPSITSRSRGPVELVRQLGAGWSIDFDDTQQLSEALHGLVRFKGSTARADLIRAARSFDSEQVFYKRFTEMITAPC